MASVLKEDVAHQDDFNVEVAIAAFVKDPAKSSLELPHMTTGQRKLARKLAEQHKELRCESFGFGAERRLHLFKVAGGSDTHAVAINDDVPSPARSRDAPSSPDTADEGSPLVNASARQDTGEATSAVSTTNTSAVLEPITSRSGPSRLSRELLPSFASCATSDVSSSDLAGPASSTPTASLPDDTLLAKRPSLSPETLQVRNTFIHIETGSGDERIVQSMPRSMFRQCLLEEQQSAAKSTKEPTACVHEAAVITAAVPQNSGSTVLIAGTSVEIQGLVKLPAFNGRRGVVQSWDEEAGRYSILIPAPGVSSGYQQAKVKAENLLLVPPSCSSGGA